MLFHDEFIKRSFRDFLHLGCLLNINSEDIKEKFSSFIIKDTEENRKKLFSHIPKDLFTEFTNKEERYLKIAKANLLRYQKEQTANPIRAWGNDNEYNTRLITSLLFGATPGWHEYCTNLYDHGQDRYIHDQRAGAGRAKQFLNWMYDDEGYPGRLEEQNEYENLIPICFPNPELLRLYFSYAGDGQYALTISDSWKKSVLCSFLNLNKEENSNKIELPKGFTINEDRKVICAPFCVWQEAIIKILEEQSLEKDLSLEQQKTHVISLIIEFVKNQAVKNKEEIQDIEQLQKKVTDFINNIFLTREPIAIIKDDKVKKQLDKKLESYSNLKKGAALKTGDCFFDSLAQRLNELKERGAIQYDSQFTVKSLRRDCKNYASENKGSWVYKKVIDDAGNCGYFVKGKDSSDEEETFNKYLQDIENIGEENGPLSIWGRLNIEGRMICEKYNIKIQVIDVLEDIEENKHVIQASGYITESEEGESENVVYMLNYKQHFVPLLSKIQQDVAENQQVSREELDIPLNNQGDGLAIQKAIEALYQVRKNITANKEFFDKFTNDKGVLQAEQYFRALTAHIDSEITFLVTFQSVLTEKDLKTFLNQTCKEVHSDINELLLAHDFLLTDDLEHRDIVINFTRKEIKELHSYISEKINYYNSLVDFYKKCETEDDIKIVKEKYVDGVKSITEEDKQCLVSAIREGRNSEDFKNKWLLHQLKLHPLSEHFKIENINEDKVGELWKVIELTKKDNNSGEESNKSNFINGLIEVINDSTDHKSKVYIEQSRWLAFKQWLYNASYHIPLSSIWLSYVNPGKSRTGTKYKGKTLKEKLYTKNRVIQTSEFSQNIRKDLNLDTGDKEFVESKHEANWLIKEFRKKHRMSGAKEKVLTYLGKNKILWYTLLTIFILFTSAAAIAGRVLSCLGIVPPVMVDRVINALRGTFDGFVVMFGLDTIIDSVFILAVDLAGLIVRCVDYLLLFGLVSKTIRYLTKGIGKVIEGISNGFKALYETIRIYGVKDSFILLHDKITNNKQSAAEKYETKEQKEERCEVEERTEKKKDIMMGQEHDIDNISSIGAQKIIERISSKNNREKVSLKVLEKKIAAIEWAINALESSGIDFAIKKAEPVFQTTKAHISAKVALHDYSEKLKELRDNKQISIDELNAHEMIFARYIADAHYMLSSIDKFTAKNHEGSSLHQFRAAFSDNCTLLVPPSHGAKNAALILGIERGGVSLLSRIKEYTVDFVEEFQDPKVFAIAFAAYYIAVQIPGLLNVACTIADAPEITLDHVGLGMVYDHFLETDVGRTLIEMVYQRGELLKDVWVLFNEFKDGIIGESELKKRWSEIKQEVKKTKSHCDHHEHGNAKERLISFINGLVHLIFTIFCINLIRSLFHKTKTEYCTFSYHQGEQITDISKGAIPDKKEEAIGNIVDDSMHNFQKVKTFLESLNQVEAKHVLDNLLSKHNVSNTSQSVLA